MALNPVQVFNGKLSNLSGVLGSAVPASTTYILKEITLYNSSTAHVNRARIRFAADDTDTGNIVDEVLPLGGTAGASVTLPFNLIMVAAEQLKGLADNANEVRCVISAVSVV